MAPDPSRSLDYYRKACDEGHIAEACHRYSAFFIKGMKGACDKNMKEAFTYSLKGIFPSYELLSLFCINYLALCCLYLLVIKQKLLFQLVNLVISAGV